MLREAQCPRPPTSARGQAPAGKSWPFQPCPPRKRHQTGFGRPCRPESAPPRRPQLAGALQQQQGGGGSRTRSRSALQGGPACPGAALGKWPLGRLPPLPLPQMTLLPSPLLSDPPATTSVLHKGFPRGSQALPYHTHSSLHPLLRPCRPPGAGSRPGPQSKAVQLSASRPQLTSAFALSAGKGMVAAPHSLHFRTKPIQASP